MRAEKQMKKMICFILVIGMILGLVPIIANGEIEQGKEIAYKEGKFDHTQLDGIDGYSYDKFENTWSYGKVFSTKYDDEMYAIVSFMVTETELLGKPNVGLSLITGAMNQDKTKTYNSDGLIFLIDESKRFSIELDNSPIAVFGTQCIPLVEAIANAKNISIKLKLHGADDVVIENDISEFAGIQEFCSNIIKFDMLYYTTATYDKVFNGQNPISISDI